MTARTITSLANPTVKAVRALHMRKTRDETGTFLAEGLKIITEAVDSKCYPKFLLHGPGLADHPLVRKAVARADETLEVSEAILGKISRRDNPQTVLAVFEQSYSALKDLDPYASHCWVALQAVRDPGNLGTIIRTLDAAGAGGVILVGDCCDPYSVEAVRATMGSIFAIPIYKTGVEDFIAWRGAWPGSVVGTTLTATMNFRDADYTTPSLILMGNEQAGLPEQLSAICDINVKIPMRGRADSLNLSVATGIMIYAVTDRTTS